MNVNLLWTLAKTDFRLRYQGTMLGFLWVVFKPLVIFFILNLVFSRIFHGGVEYSLGLFIGIILWNFFSEGTSTGLVCFLQKAHIISKIFVPKWEIVVASLLNPLFGFFLNLFVLALFFLLAGKFPSLLDIFLFLALCTLVFLFILTFSFLFSPLYLRFRDTHQIWDLVLMIGFYGCPILYSFDVVSEKFQRFLFLNPMTFPILEAKNLLLKSEHLPFWIWGLVFLGSFVFLGMSFFIFSFTSRRVAENI